tara:strand:- start:904 stop:1509 length:606 start_codon:yes stop_codon:yes gene_type:complete
MKIMAIETSGLNCGVGIWFDQKLISIKEEIGNKIHSEKLPKFVKNVLKESNLELKDLDAIAVSTGPGSYTGLRIGMSFAKGLAFGSKIQLLPIDTISSIEENFKKDKELIILVYSHTGYVYEKQCSDIKGEIIQTKIKDIYSKPLLCVNFPENKKNIPKSKYILTSVEFIGNFATKNYFKLEKPRLFNISPKYFSEFNIRK